MKCIANVFNFYAFVRYGTLKYLQLEIFVKIYAWFWSGSRWYGDRQRHLE